MRLSIKKSKNFEFFYIIKDYTINKKRTTKIVEKLGTLEEVKKKAGNQDYMSWIKSHINKLNETEKEGKRIIPINHDPNKEIPMNEQLLFNGGYLFLQNIYYKLGLNKICNKVADKYKFTYDLNDILSKLIYGRIIEPNSKSSTYEFSKKLLERPNFELHHIYRALEILHKEIDYIQSELYKNSLKISKRKTGVIYYDCTNYYFEIKHNEGLKQYTGNAKDKKGVPVTQMGLFMDGNGIPLAFNITPGNKNEQITMTPTEEKIIKDFGLSKFVVVTDAGLASVANRKFNNVQERAFITVQSVKKLKEELETWMFDSNGWRIEGIDKKIDITKLEDDIDLQEKFKNKIFYKERWITDKGFEQRLIVTYTVKYKNYQQKVRAEQINRALKYIENPSTLNKVSRTDAKRFITKTSEEEEGKKKKKITYSFNADLAIEESKYDGYYGICTNLDDEVCEIIKINKQRWEIEESFKIMKSEFEARPVYLSNDERIIAHFITCFLSLVIFRYLEKEVNKNRLPKDEYTYPIIIDTLKNFNFKHYINEGYTPCYTRTEFTDLLEKKFGIKTHVEIVSEKNIKKICKAMKN